jgi:hypothetical protein
MKIERNVINDFFWLLDKSVSKDETRYFMNCVFVDCETQKMIFVATDGRRLYRVTLRDKVCEDFKKVWKYSGNEEFPLGESRLVVTSRTAKVMTMERGDIDKLGKFPQYSRVIPLEREDGPIYCNDMTYEARNPEQEHPKLCARLGVALNFRYVEDMKASRNRRSWMVFHDTTESKSARAVQFVRESEGICEDYVVMPITLD